MIDTIKSANEASTPRCGAAIRFIRRAGRVLLATEDNTGMPMGRLGAAGLGV